MKYVHVPDDFDPQRDGAHLTALIDGSEGVYGRDDARSWRFPLNPKANELNGLTDDLCDLFEASPSFPSMYPGCEHAERYAVADLATGLLDAGEWEAFATILETYADDVTLND